MTEVLAPELSIVLPTFNRAEFLKQCLDSLLAQNCGGYELLIRDNNSQDDTASVVREYQAYFVNKKVRLVYRVNPENVGFRENMVQGLKELSGRYAMILMDDDFFINALALGCMYNAIASNDSVKLVTAKVRSYFCGKETESIESLIEQGKLSSAPTHQIVKGDEYFLNSFSKYPPIVLSSVIFDRNAVLNSKWEQWSQRAALDVNMYNILALSGDIALFPSALSGYRIHEGQDFCTFPLEDAIESHSRISNWHALANLTGRFSWWTLLLWRIKTVVLKDQGVVIRLQQRGNGETLEKYFSWLLKYNLGHYVLMRQFMPCMIRNTRENKIGLKPFKKLLCIYADCRRSILRAFLHLYRRKYDPEYQTSLLIAMKGGQ
ncbi:MAG: glycosyltransferase family 2 protein [Aestuariibacter sp.]